MIRKRKIKKDGKVNGCLEDEVTAVMDDGISVSVSVSVSMRV